MLVKQMKKLALLLITLIATGCAPVADLQLTENLGLVIKRVDVDKDSYDIVVAFRDSTEHCHIIQEVIATGANGNRYEIVESFDSDCKHVTEWDYHSGDRISGWERREYRFYAGDITNNDPTPSGFSILERNIDGSVRTRLPEGVNTQHTHRHDIQGWVTNRHPETGLYEIYWEPNRVVITTDVATITRERGRRAVVSYGLTSQPAK